MATKKIDVSEQAQHSALCRLVDAHMLDVMHNSGGGITRQRPDGGEIYWAPFLGAEGSVVADSLNFVARNFSVICIDEKRYFVPKRTSEKFIAEAKAAYPSAVVKVHASVTLA